MGYTIYTGSSKSREDEFLDMLKQLNGGNMAKNALTDKELYMLRGKAITVGLDAEEASRVFKHLDELEGLLDEGDDCDAFGTEGWRHYLGID